MSGQDKASPQWNKTKQNKTKTLKAHHIVSVGHVDFVWFDGLFVLRF